jgi:lipopolysaccharide export system permease protein
VKILHRYIFSSIAIAMLLSAGLFSFVLIAANIVHDIVERIASGQLSYATAARMIALLVPFTMSFAAPMGLLIGILIVLGRMSARNEIVAMKSAGISLWRMSRSIFTLAMIVVAICAVFNNWYAPIARAQYKQMLSQLVQEAPLRFIVPGRFVRDFPDYVIYAGMRDGSKLSNIWIWVLGPDREVRKFLQARSGTIVYDEDKNILVMDVYDATGESRSGGDFDDLSVVRPQAVIEHLSFSLPMGKLISKAKTSKTKPKLSHMSLTELLNVHFVSRATMDSSEHGSPEWKNAQVQMARADYNISRNFAFAFSALALTIIAIPLGIKVGRQETYANMAVALVLGMAYFFLVFITGWAEKTPEAFPQFLVWVPNFIFFGLGLWMMCRSNRH